MQHDKSYYLEKNKHTQEFQVHKHWTWCFTASVKWRKRRKTISDHEDDSGHKISNVALWQSPQANWRCYWAPRSIALAKHFIESSHHTDTPPDALMFIKGEKKSLYTKLKPLVLGFFVAQKYPSVSFSQTSMGKAAFPQTKTWGTENAKGFHIAGPNSARVGQWRGESFSFTRCLQ